MSRRCSVDAAKGNMVGNKVSHSQIKTKRRFLPNLQIASFFSDILGRFVKLRVSVSTMRTIEHNNGIDAYLAKTKPSKLTAEARKLQKMMQGVPGSKQEEKVSS